MKVIMIDDIKIKLKRKTIMQKIMSKDEALEYFDVFIKEYTENSLEEVKTINKTFLVEFVLKYYTFSNESSFINFSNNLVEKFNQLEYFAITYLVSLDYKVTDLLKLTHQELFNVFTIEFYNKSCFPNPNFELIKKFKIILEYFEFKKEVIQQYLENGKFKEVEDKQIVENNIRIKTDEEEAMELANALKNID